MRVVYLSVFLSFCFLSLEAQEEKKIAEQAYLITRMVQRFHVLPKQLDTDFSADFFKQFISTINEGNLILLKADVDSLNQYQHKLAEEIKNKQTGFLNLTIQLFKKRFKQVDSLTKLYTDKPFNLMLKETLTEAESNRPPTDLAEQQQKLYKWIKYKILEELVEQSDIEEHTNTDSLIKQLPVLEPLLRKKAIASFQRSIRQITENQSGITDAVGKIYCKVLASCFDPHTSFLPPAERENFENAMGKAIPKFGFSLSAEDEELVIDDLLPGSAAYKSGQLNTGDKIEKLQWEGKDPIDVSGASQKEISDILGSGNQAKLTLTVRKTDGTVRQVVLQKELVDEELKEEKVQGYILEGKKKIGFVALPDFYTDWEDRTNSINGCANDLAKEIIRLKKENIDGLILDLRFNGGGSMQEAIDLSGIFIDAGPVGQLKTKDDKIITFKDVNRGMVYDGPLVILVNAFSASASEMVAGTLQDYNRAIIIGSPTFGKGTAQVIMPLDTSIDMTRPLSFKPNSNSIKLTVEHLYRVTGITVQSKGVLPDIILPDFFQAAGQREKDQPFSLKPSDVPANKYYQPLQHFQPLDAVKRYAANISDTLGYFQVLNQYIQYYQALTENKNVPLHLPALLEQQQTMARLTHQLDSLKMNYYTNFSISRPQKKAASAFSAEQLTGETWKKNLSTDPYIDIAYRILAIPPQELIFYFLSDKKLQ